MAVSDQRSPLYKLKSISILLQRSEVYKSRVALVVDLRQTEITILERLNKVSMYNGFMAFVMTPSQLNLVTQKMVERRHYSSTLNYQIVPQQFPT